MGGGVPPDPGDQRKQGDERRKLESYLRDERSRLDADQHRELNAAADRAKADQIRQRQNSERQALDQQAQHERQMLEQRFKWRAAERANQHSKMAQKDRGKGKSQDHQDRN